MREIKFKAKRSDGEWVESTSIQNNPFGKTYLMDAKRLVECYNKEVMPSNIWVEIDPNTLCQFTGLTDKNGKEIYEGDILSDGKGDNGLVLWIETLGGFRVYVDNILYHLNEGDPNRRTRLEYTEIIGNIHNK